MHKHLIKWLSKIKREKGVPHMLAPRRRCLYYPKVYSDVTKTWFLELNQNEQITYYIFYTLIPNSVLIFITIAQICYQQISIIKTPMSVTQP